MGSIAGSFMACVALCCAAEAEKPVAVVLSKEIRRAELRPSERQVKLRKDDLHPDEYEKWQKSYPTERLVTLIKGPLLEDYKQEYGLAATEAFWPQVSRPWGDGTLTQQMAREMFSSPDYLPK
jgi:hypothetical protein